MTLFPKNLISLSEAWKVMINLSIQIVKYTVFCEKDFINYWL